MNKKEECKIQKLNNYNGRPRPTLLPSVDRNTESLLDWRYPLFTLLSFTHTHPPHPDPVHSTKYLSNPNSWNAQTKGASNFTSGHVKKKKNLYTSACYFHEKAISFLLFNKKRLLKIFMVCFAPLPKNLRRLSTPSEKKEFLFKLLHSKISA